MLITYIFFTCLILSSCENVTPEKTNPQNEISDIVTSSNKTSEDEILVTVFGKPIYKSEYEKAIAVHPNVQSKEILEGLVMEAVVLNKASELGYTVTETEIEDKISELKKMNPTYFELAVKQYETEEDYLTALGNRLLYTKVFDTISEEIKDKYKYKNDVMEEETNKYILANNIDSDMHNEIKNAFISNYSEIVKQVYFKKWNYELAKSSEIEYFSYTEKKLFSVSTDDDNGSDVVIDKGIPNFSNIDIDTAQKTYSAYLNLQSPYLKQNFEIESVKSTPATQTKFQKLFVSYTSKHYSGKRVTISLVLTPFASLNTFTTPTERGVGSTSLNGFDGYIKLGHSEETDTERSLVSLGIYLSEINGILTFSSENCTKDDIYIYDSI